MERFDAIIVGSGPTGVSAAFPLLQAGLRILIVDGGKQAAVTPPDGDFLDRRLNDQEQWSWMLGDDFHALKNLTAASPKLRAPTHSHVFENFHSANRIVSEGFMTLGSLAAGGLSNAWGCGVARLSTAELTGLPPDTRHLDGSYETVARRMGISGASDDDLKDYFGVDAWAQEPIAMDAQQSALLKAYGLHRNTLLGKGFRLGRSRLAALSQPLGERQACNLSGFCLWGCRRKALYSAVQDLSVLRQHPNCHYETGFVVEGLGAGGDSCSITGRYASSGHHAGFSARRLILSAGTLASTHLVLLALQHRDPVRLLSSPTGAFLLWMPRYLGAPRQSSFGLGQLSFTLSLPREEGAFGSLFSSTAIPVSEFVRFVPMGPRHSIDVLSILLGSCVVGNLFLQGHLTEASASLRSNGDLYVNGKYGPDVAPLMIKAKQILRASFLKLGALLLPRSFSIGRPGSDIHYTGSLPMTADPVPGQTNSLGEVFGLPGVHVVDGACFPILTEKSHTLSIMANADRIGRALAQILVRNP